MTSKKSYEGEDPPRKRQKIIEDAVLCVYCNIYVNLATHMMTCEEYQRTLEEYQVITKAKAAHGDAVDKALKCRVLLKRDCENFHDRKRLLKDHLAQSKPKYISIPIQCTLPSCAPEPKVCNIRGIEPFESRIRVKITDEKRPLAQGTRLHEDIMKMVGHFLGGNYRTPRERKILPLEQKPSNNDTPAIPVASTENEIPPKTSLLEQILEKTDKLIEPPVVNTPTASTPAPATKQPQLQTIEKQAKNPSTSALCPVNSSSNHVNTPHIQQNSGSRIITDTIHVTISYTMPSPSPPMNTQPPPLATITIPTVSNTLPRSMPMLISPTVIQTQTNVVQTATPVLMVPTIPQQVAMNTQSSFNGTVQTHQYPPAQQQQQQQLQNQQSNNNRAIQVAGTHVPKAILPAPPKQSIAQLMSQSYHQNAQYQPETQQQQQYQTEYQQYAQRQRPNYRQIQEELINDTIQSSLSPLNMAGPTNVQNMQQQQQRQMQYTQQQQQQMAQTQQRKAIYIQQQQQSYSQHQQVQQQQQPQQMVQQQQLVQPQQMVQQQQQRQLAYSQQQQQQQQQNWNWTYNAPNRPHITVKNNGNVMPMMIQKQTPPNRQSPNQNWIPQQNQQFQQMNGQLNIQQNNAQIMTNNVMHQNSNLMEPQRNLTPNSQFNSNNNNLPGLLRVKNISELNASVTTPCDLTPSFDSNSSQNSIPPSPPSTPCLEDKYQIKVNRNFWNELQVGLFPKHNPDTFIKIDETSGEEREFAKRCLLDPSFVKGMISQFESEESIDQFKKQITKLFDNQIPKEYYHLWRG